MAELILLFKGPKLVSRVRTFTIYVITTKFCVDLERNSLVGAVIGSVILDCCGSARRLGELKFKAWVIW